MDKKAKGIVHLKKLGRFFALLFALLFFIEIASGYIYFQRSWEKGVAGLWLFERITDRYSKESNQVIGEKSYSNNAIVEKYSTLLEALIKKTKKNNTTLILLYIPSFREESSRLGDHLVEHAISNDILYIDVRGKFLEYENDWLYQQPNDAHLSVFGHNVVAKEISYFIEKNITTTFNSTPLSHKKIEGPHPKNVNQLRVYNNIPYYVVTNSSGFRMHRELEPTAGLKVLALGDSFTFGTTVNNEFAYPNILDRKIASINFINAGVPGANLEEKLAIFDKLSESIDPNILLFQILDDDIE